MNCHIQCPRCKIPCKKPYRLAVLNNKNHLRDFDTIPKLPGGAYAEIFVWERKNILSARFRFVSDKNTIFQDESGCMPPEKFCKITLKYTRF